LIDSTPLQAGFLFGRKIERQRNPLDLVFIAYDISAATDAYRLPTIRLRLARRMA